MEQTIIEQTLVRPLPCLSLLHTSRRLCPRCCELNTRLCLRSCETRAVGCGVQALVRYEEGWNEVKGDYLAAVYEANAERAAVERDKLAENARRDEHAHFGCGRACTCTPFGLLRG